MAALRNPKRERFCLLVAQGTTHAMAARDVGFAHPGVAGAKLARQPAIAARIAALEERIDVEKAKRIVNVLAPTREWVIKELCDAVGVAKEVGDRGATLKGLELVGRELGMFVQRSMVIESPLQRLPADRLLALLALVEEAVSLPATVAPSVAPALLPDPPTIEAEAEERW